MPVTEKHAPGSFCWMELHTTDQGAAKQFYTSLFGWEIADFALGPDEIYTIFRLRQRDCAAACTLRPDLRQQGVPPHWLLYIATADVDASAKQVVELGGKVVSGPFDVGESGRMAVVQDSAGAHFSLWQGKQTHGIGIAGEPGAFCWADLNTPARDGARRFYSALAGWSFTPGQGKDESTYLHIENGAAMIGGLPPAEAQPPGAPPHWLLYFMAEDCVALTSRAGELGARVYAGPMQIEGAGVISVLADPQGAVFALFEPAV